jgi:ankyrin repeat protein
MMPLHHACKYGYESAAEQLIERADADKLFANPSYVETACSMALHLACRNKTERPQIVSRLLSKVRDAGTSSKQRSSLTSNSGSGGVAGGLLEQLLRKEEAATRQTALHMAIENNHLTIVELLFRDYNVPRDLRDSHTGNLPVHVCAKSGSAEMLRVLQRYDALSFKPNASMETALHVAAAANKPKLLRELLDYEKWLLSEQHMQQHGVVAAASTSTSPAISSSISSDFYIPCMCKCDLVDSQHVSCVRRRDSRQYTPLLTALGAGNQRCVEELIGERECELDARDKDGNTVYHICAECDNAESLKYLLNSGVCFDKVSVLAKNAADETLMHSACRNGNLEMVKLVVNKLQEESVPIEAFLYGKNNAGQTCFHVACSKGFFNIVEYFLKDKHMNAFVEQSDNSTNTALHLATLNGHSGIVSMLLEHGADVNAKNEDNNTALDLSCRKGYFEISKVLINSYASIGQQTERANENPLHVACYEGAHEVVKLLLLKGAAIDRLNDENKNCLDIAISRGHREVTNYL